MQRRQIPMTVAAFVALSLALDASAQSTAGGPSSVDAVLARASAPAGVVFEIVSGDPHDLRRQMPRVKREAERLRARFAGLPFAVVTHGAEQFSLLRDNASRYPDVHALVRDLTGSNAVDVHVCGTHASWRDNVPEDFPDYVDVAAGASSQINDYLALGYVHVLL